MQSCFIPVYWPPLALSARAKCLRAVFECYLVLWFNPARFCGGVPPGSCSAFLCSKLGVLGSGFGQCFLRLGGHQLSRVPPVVLKQHWHFALAGQFVYSSNLVSILFCTVPLPTLRVPCGCSGCCAVVVRCCVVCGCGVAQATHPQRMSSVPDCSFTNKQGADGDVCCVLVCCVLQQPLVVCCVTMQHNRVSVWPVRRPRAVQCSVHSCCVTMCQGKCWKCEQRIQLWLCWAGVPL